MERFGTICPLTPYPFRQSAKRAKKWRNGPLPQPSILHCLAVLQDTIPPIRQFATSPGAPDFTGFSPILASTARTPSYHDYEFHLEVAWHLRELHELIGVIEATRHPVLLLILSGTL
jgi:hypothetical protein